MKTVNEVALTIYRPIGMTENEFATALAKEYAREAIKADRENVAKHAKTVFQSTWKQEIRGIQSEVDKDSIINAPQIELK